MTGGSGAPMSTRSRRATRLEKHKESVGSPVAAPTSFTPSARANGPNKEFEKPSSPTSKLMSWYEDHKNHDHFVDIDKTLTLKEQGVALVDATNSALESGLFYAPVATCTEEAADVASQMMELPSLEWFQLPLASTGDGVLVVKRDTGTPHRFTCGQVSKCLLEACRRDLGKDVYSNVSDVGAKRRPVQEAVRKSREPDIQLVNRRLPLLPDRQQPHKTNRFPITGEVAHTNEDLATVQEEIAYLVQGTDDVQVAFAIKLKTTKDAHGRYQDPHMTFFACSYHNPFTVHHGGLDFGADTGCNAPGLMRYCVRIASDPIVHLKELEGRFLYLDLFQIREDLQINLRLRSPGGQLSSVIGVDAGWPSACAQAMHDVIQTLGLRDSKEIPEAERKDLLVHYARDF